jgi:aminoglycoside 3-N-acetyltransferase I
MTYIVKHLSPSDAEILKLLIATFRVAFDDAAYEGAVPSPDYLHAFLSKPHVVVLVAMRGAEVVGGLVAYELEKFEQDRREIYIYDLAVAEPHRRQGIATRLIRALQRLGKERDAFVIFVQADHGDTAAIRLYESLGTREDVYHFDIPVD